MACDHPIKIEPVPVELEFAPPIKMARVWFAAFDPSLPIQIEFVPLAVAPPLSDPMAIAPVALAFPPMDVA